jgi:hypothetical protein
MANFKNEINWTEIKGDTNGNPRYVCHYLNFNGFKDGQGYEIALNTAKPLGGKKFHNKQYGGGIVFQIGCISIDDISEKILILTGQARECHRPPTAGEIKFGEGATHYKTFLIKDITNKKGALKKWFRCPVDGLNYSTK